MTPAQLTAIKAYINSVPELASLPNNSDGAFVIAAVLNVAFAPTYLVWRTNISRSEVYNTIGPSGSEWDWTLYKSQGVPEQNAWTQMFMGDQADFGKKNLRVGIGKIFTAGSSVNRDHAFAIAKRPATVAEKLLAVPVLTPPANTGNDAAQPRGSVLNPDVMTFEGQISPAEVEVARNS